MLSENGEAGCENEKIKVKSLFKGKKGIMELTFFIVFCK